MPRTVKPTRFRLLPLLFLPFLSGCGRETESPGPAHVILISLDTLRQDHVGIYGSSSAASTPALDDLARAAVVFDQAFAPVAFTLPSHMSMLTGLHPEVHGVHGSKARLNTQVATLAESLAGQGYHTLGLVSNLWMKGNFGFDRGFDHYERVDYALTYSDRINRRAFELLDARSPESVPIFLFLHYIDPHSDFFRIADNTLPYYAPAEYLEKTGVAPDSREFCEEPDKCATDYLLTLNKEGRAVSAQELAQIRALYRSGIEYLDKDLGELFAGLRQRGLWDNALVILTSDHGEEFLEHGEFIHSQPYVENLAVPLFIRLPRDQQGGTRVTEMVQLTDLLPTILDWQGLEVPAGIQGRSLVPMIRGERLPPIAALGRDKKNSRKFALRTNRYTLVHDFDSGISELYDRLADPSEFVAIQAENGEVAERMLSGLEVLIAQYRAAGREVGSHEQMEKILSSEEEQKLRAIGYLD